MKPRAAVPSASDCEVVVCGGGPAGATTAALLARAGRRVVLLEKERFPRFHIGESLLPASNSLFARLGIERADLRSRFVSKHGAILMSDCGTIRSRVEFAGAPGVDQPETFHVRRAEFDQLLLERARALGAEVHEACELLDCAFADGAERKSGGAPAGEAPRPRVTARHADGREQVFTPRYVVDASGRVGVLARRLGCRVMDADLRMSSLYAHCRTSGRLGGREAGDIRVLTRADGGWAWCIPLDQTSLSIGFVFRPEERAREPDEAPEDTFDRWLARSPLLLDGVCSSPADCRRAGPAHWESDFSYATRSYVGPDWLLVGDAGSFLDPVFSSGVQLALVGGADAADALHAALDAGPARRRRLLAKYDREQARRYRFFRRLVLGFYRPSFRALLMMPENFPSIARAVASALAGEDRPGPLTRVRQELMFLAAKRRAARSPAS